jgi:hypothetical protein
MTYRLSRADCGRLFYRKTTIASGFADIAEALDYLSDVEGYNYIQSEEDADHPQHWDIFATAKDGRANVYTLEPVKA